MARPVHWNDGTDKTACCGRKMSDLGLGAKLSEDLAEVTCSKAPEAEEVPEKEEATEGLRLREGDQQLPVPNDLPDIQSLVIADIVQRRELGIQRYGTALQAFNGRDATRDLYEELLDGAMYARQILFERQALVNRIAELEAEVAARRANEARLHRAYLMAQGIPEEDLPS